MRNVSIWKIFYYHFIMFRLYSRQIYKCVSS